MWDIDTANEAGAALDAQFADQPLARMGATTSPSDGGPLALMVQAAQQLQREPAKMIASAKQIGGLLGKSGFYSFPAGGSTVEGPSIDMAQALAQQWGGIAYQVRIVEAQPLASGGQRVHLRASVADMRSLVCAEVDQVVTTAPAPGKFAQKIDQRERWNGMQVQSAASKIVRNAILRVLPAWYVEPAFAAAQAVDAGKALGGKSLPDARAAAADALQRLGAAVPELEQYLGQPMDLWAVPQLSALRELYGQLRDHAVSLEAWRAGLQDRAAGSVTPMRNALGLPAHSTAKSVDKSPLNQPTTTGGKGVRTRQQKSQPEERDASERTPTSEPTSEARGGCPECDGSNPDCAMCFGGGKGDEELTE